uniref:ARAD1B11770p n=1 Tax=Blastobotrys adeninivorans TaxID=409370 RepID=A0A060TB08_BLAAD
MKKEDRKDRMALLELPPELLCMVIDCCDVGSLPNLLLACRDTNMIARDSILRRLRKLVEPSERLVRRQGVLLSMSCPDQRPGWRQTAFVGSDCDYCYDRDYSTVPCNKQKKVHHCPPDSFPRAKFARKEACGALVEIGEDEEFTHVMVQISLASSRSAHTPVSLIRKFQRIHKTWAGEEYLVHDKAVNLRLRVDRVSPEPVVNSFGESVHQYHVQVREMVVNCVHLLNKVETLVEGCVRIPLAA